MLLFLLVIIPFCSSFVSYLSFKLNKCAPRYISLISIILILFVTIKIWFSSNFYTHHLDHYPNWNYQLILPWIPRFGIEFHLAIDSFSIIMLFLTFFLGIIAILCAWNEIKENEGFFYFNFMLVLTGVIGIFIACDLFLFFFCWEIILVPMYFLISLWGNNRENKSSSINAANKFFIYAQISGLVMLVSILLLVFSYYQNTHILTFNYNLLLFNTIDSKIEYIIMLGFFISFIIKMPIVPFHGWLSDFHAESSYCGAVDIIGSLLKIAPYGLFRYSMTLFPNTIQKIAPIAMFLGLFSIFYGALLAFSQKNIKRLIAYASISHMGLILIAIYSNNEIAFQGVIIQIISSSISTAALCIISGQIYKYFNTQNILKMGGFWSNIYWIPAFSLFFALSNLGLPGTGNFIGEFLILFGTFKTYSMISIIAVISIVFSSIYSLYMIQRIYYGPSQKSCLTLFPNIKELWILIILMLVLIFLGVMPQKILNIAQDTISSIYHFQKEFINSILKTRL
ncbi:NADH-quinone oxidoreductase subunit M [Buchnera aphidicola (Aphis helianthi)]|uniref:NADH-quinone oxidoreductase subunit M n=1 Tax=Buchnera aphidicola (Aphis helianthi) TaxID=2315802 RepID=A0A4D6XW71_9GAMM|nr:NADH-quinone oxidoreductase subunit M [Buchnera aphidicola]QCI16995.1 NADH-quinone oxidoreductase subunit M [Buchnera aphidicola (Aphis helianthi)]